MFPTIRYFSVYYSQPNNHYSHLKVCLLQLQQVGMRHIVYIVSMHMYFLRQEMMQSC